MKFRHYFPPLALFCAFAGLFLLLWRMELRRERDEAQRLTQLTVDQTALRLEDYLDFRMQLIEELHDEWERGLFSTHEQFVWHARVLETHFPGFAAVNWITADGALRWTVPVAAGGNADDVQLPSGPMVPVALAEAARDGAIRMTPPFTGADGERRISAYRPLVRDGELHGYLNAVFRVSPMIAHCLRGGFGADFGLEIFDGEVELYSADHGDAGHEHAYAAEQKLVVAGREWRMVLSPLASPDADPLLLLGLLLSASLAVGGHALLRRDRALRESLSHLAASEGRYRQLVDASPLGVTTVDTAGRILSVNRAQVELVGAPDAAALLHHDVNDMSVGVQPAVLEAGQRCLETGESQGTDVSYTTEWDRQVDVRVNLAPLRDTRGVITGLLALTEDIGERKRAERELQRRVELDRLVSRIAADMVNVDADDLGAGIERALSAIGSFVDADRCALFQMSADDRAMSATQQWSAAGAPRTASNLQALPVEAFPWFLARSRAGQTVVLERVSDLPPEAAGLKDILTRLGVCSFASVPLRSGGAFLGFVQFTRTGTEYAWPEDTVYLLTIVGEILANAVQRQHMESLVRKSAEELRLTIDRAAVGIAHVDLEGRYTRVNPEFCAMVGYTESELLASTFLDVTHPEDRRSHVANSQSALRGDTDNYRVEKRIVHRDGHTVWVLITSSLLRTAGEPDRFIAVYHDITDQKRAEEERRSLERQVQHAQKLESLGVLAGGIAHDFNNLLMGILGNASVALGDLPPSAPAREPVQAVETAALRAAELTRQLLAYSGKSHIAIEPLDLNVLTLEMTQLLDTVISKKADLQCHLAAELPPVNGDASQMRQVLMNLITNASDALDSETGEITIRSGVMSVDHVFLANSYYSEDLVEGEYVFVEVSDTGCGMDEDTRARIFDPFFTTKFTGRGLGLAAVLGIARAHGGAVQVESTPGVGTTFCLLIPVSNQLVAQPDEVVEAHVDAWEGSGVILVVDDEDTVRDVARRILERSGYTVVTAADGREALDAFQAHAGAIEAVLLDMTMPHMDGAETFTELQRRHGDVRVILTTGYSEQEATTGFNGGGPAGFLQKPYRAATLLAKVREVLTS